MKAMNVVRRFGGKVGAGAAVLAAGTGVAMADASDAVTAITGVGSDVTTIGWAAIGVLALAAGFKYIRRAF